jgi:hypothetical protein
MKGRLYRRQKDGYIYEVVAHDQAPGVPDLWVLWNERAGERQFAMGVELERQVGWELVGTAKSAATSERSNREVPAALMK